MTDKARKRDVLFMLWMLRLIFTVPQKKTYKHLGKYFMDKIDLIKKVKESNAKL